MTAIEINEDCVAQLHRNAGRNALAIAAQPGNAFDMLHDLERQRAQYDLIILDPPSFTKTKGKLHDAARGYKEIHLRALQLLAPDGLRRINDHPASRLDELLPWNWKHRTAILAA